MSAVTRLPWQVARRGRYARRQATFNQEGRAKRASRRSPRLMSSGAGAREPGARRVIDSVIQLYGSPPRANIIAARPPRATQSGRAELAEWRRKKVRCASYDFTL